MLESKLQSKCIKELKKRGWFVRKILSTNCPGDPDLYCHKDNRTVWIETKQLGKPLRPLQELRGNEIIEAGMEFYKVDEFGQLLTIFG